MIRGIPGSLTDLMNRRGVEVIRDHGRFAGPNAVAVNGEILEAKHIVIATGSKPRKLPFPGAEVMITSDDVLSERRLPAEVVFVGGGVIALEFSHVYARAGAKVTILEALPRLLDNMDRQPIPWLALQQMRAVEVLEQMDTPEARELLGELANGAPAARQTREALAALNRLVKRNPGGR